MKKHTFKEWLIAVRPWSFPASAVPVLATLAYLQWSRGDVDWVSGIWALLNIVLFHAAGNTWSDYHDFERGVDAPDTFGVKTLTGGMFRPQEIRRLSLGLLAVACAAGLGLMLRTGWPLLAFGLAGIALSIGYPWLKYRALGDADIFLTYALLPMLGTSYVATGSVDGHVLWLALPIGLITVAILHCNNTRDMQTDARVHIRTLAMLLGGRKSVALYCLEILLPFLWLLGCALGGAMPWWVLLAWGALLPAAGNVRKAVAYFRDGQAALAHLDEFTAKLQLLFGLLVSLSFLIAVWVG